MAEQRDRHGFRVREAGMTRLDAFVDAAFAFAVTMLVISIEHIPDSMPALVRALKTIPAFAVCFAMVAMFWNAHATWSRRYGLTDGWSKVLSLLLVFLVLVYIYPLRLQFGVMFNWISGGWLPSPIRMTDAPSDITFMYVVYGLAFTTMSLCMLGLYAHAWRKRRHIGLDREESARTWGEVGIYAFFAGAGVLSILLALLASGTRTPWMLALPGMAYFLLTFTGLVEQRVSMRAWRREVAATRGQA